MNSKKTKTEIKISKDLKRAIDNFPKVVKAHEKAAKEKQRIMKNFLSVKTKVYR